MPKIKNVDEVVGAPVLAAAWFIAKGGAWAPAGQVAGVAGALVGEAMRRRDATPSPAAPEGDLVIAVTASEVVATSFSNLLGIKAKEVKARLPREQVVGATLEGKKIIKTLTLQLADGSSWAFDCRTASHKDAAKVVEALGF